jgi:hypothetical protein
LEKQIDELDPITQEQMSLGFWIYQQQR